MKSTVSVNTAFALAYIRELMDKREKVNMSQVCARYKVARSTIYRAIHRGELDKVQKVRNGSVTYYVYQP